MESISDESTVPGASVPFYLDPIFQDMKGGGGEGVVSKFNDSCGNGGFFSRLEGRPKINGWSGI